MRRLAVLGALALGVVMSAWAQHGPGSQHGQGSPHAEGGQTLSLQGDTKAWSDNPHMHAFYELTRERLGKGAPELDFDKYRDDA